jgi:putative ABC transport system substrate-binding protein
MWIIKKGIVSAVVFLIVALFSTGAGAEKRIGILQSSEDVRYLEATKAFVDKLKEAGFGEPQTKIIVEHAGANKAKAAELAQKFAAAKMDLIFTLGTPATVTVALEIKDVPVVFAVVYDPVEAGIAKQWESSGNNTTGTSTKASMPRIVDVLKRFAPVKNLAVLYTPIEQQSVSALRDLQKIQEEYRIKVIPVPLSKAEEVSQLLPILTRSADALYVTGSVFVGSQLSTIVDMAMKSKMITITHLEDLVERGVLLGVSADFHSGGRLAGEKAIKILKGAQPSSIPIEIAKQLKVVINLKTARAAGFQVLPDFMKTVTKTIR